MRIAINCQLLSTNLSGIGIYVWNLVKALSNVDPINEYHLSINSRVDRTLLPENAHFTLHTTKLSLLGTKTRILWEHLIQPSSLASHDIDLFHSPDCVLPVFPIYCKSVITIHDLSFFIYPQAFTRSKLLYKTHIVRIAARKAARIIAITETTKADILRFLDVPDHKIIVIPYGIDKAFRAIPDSEILRRTKAKYRLPAHMVLYVGTLEPRKNLPNLIRAYHVFKKQKTLPHKLVIVGAKGWLQSGVFQLVGELGLTEDILFTGHIPNNELPYFYNLSELLVYPSFYEGFGLPPLEAMACGTPVVTSNTSSIPEVTGDAAMMVDPYDVKAIAEAMHLVLTKKELKRRLVNKGLARAATFSWESTAKQTLEVFKRVTEG